MQYLFVLLIRVSDPQSRKDHEQCTAVRRNIKRPMGWNDHKDLTESPALASKSQEPRQLDPPLIEENEDRGLDPKHVAAESDQEDDDKMPDYASLKLAPIIPRRGTKSFEPLAHLPLSQSMALRSSLNAMYTAIQAPAAFHSLKHTSAGVVNVKDQGSTVRVSRGTQWATMGRMKDGAMSATPEESVYLAERRSLALSVNGADGLQVPLSVQGIYSHSLLSGGGAYNVYATLKRFGYTVGKFDHSGDITFKTDMSNYPERSPSSWLLTSIRWLLTWMKGCHAFSEFNLYLRRNDNSKVLQSLPKSAPVVSIANTALYQNLEGVAGCVTEWAVSRPRPGFKKSKIISPDYEIIVLDPLSSKQDSEIVINSCATPFREQGNIPSLSEWKILLRRRTEMPKHDPSKPLSLGIRDRIKRIKVGDLTRNKVVAVWDEGATSFMQIAFTDFSQEPILY